MKRFLVFATVLTIVALACAPAFAFEFQVESRSGGLNYGNFAQSGFANSTGNSSASGVSQIGSMYSGTTVYFGPSRFARALFTPTTSGYYNIDLAWPSTAGQTQTAVTLYTGAETGGDLDQWGNAAQQGVITRGTMDMYYRATNTWNRFTTAKLNTGTGYKVGVYGGYKSLNAAPDLSNRVAVQAFKFSSAVAGAVTAGALNEFNELSWTKGANNAAFNVYFGMEGEPLSMIGTLDESVTTMAVDYDYLAAGTYFWRVDAVNVDNVTTGSVYSFVVEAVPEPSSFLALGTGLIGLLGVIRRKKS